LQPAQLFLATIYWITLNCLNRRVGKHYIENKFVGNSFIAFTCLWPVLSEIANLQLAASHVIMYGCMKSDEGKMYMHFQLWKLHENSGEKNWIITEDFRTRQVVYALNRGWSIT
jgi:hypothetical protein